MKLGGRLTTNLRLVGVIKRTLLFIVFFSLVPAIVAVFSSVLYRSGGLRGSSGGSLALLAWRADRGFVAWQLVNVALSSGGVALLLGLASLLAWRDEQGYAVIRIGRFVAFVWLVSIILFPGMAAWLPVFRQIPWTIGVLLLLFIIGAGYAWRPARAGLREWCFTIITSIVFFYSPRLPSKPLDSLARRPFSPRDVIVVGFDSVKFDDTSDVLDRFAPSRGRKIIYANAKTTFPATSQAWRSILSGNYPPSTASLPDLRWGSDRDGWLPAELRANGYIPTIAEDMPESNWFGSDESIRVIGNQGWKASVQTFAWKVGFPLSTAAAAWWIGALGAPTTSVGRFAHCAECFIEESLKKIARQAARGPVFGAIHTCLVHPPYLLSLTETLRVPGWWSLTPTFFLGQGSYSSDLRSREVRINSLRDTLKNTLTLLDRGGVLGRATVFLLADHGPRSEGGYQEKTNIMLTLFSPLGHGNAIVHVPVSLIDIAPTIRQIVGLPKATTDGRPLPRTDTEGDAERVVLTATVKPLSVVYQALGIGGGRVSAEDIAKLGHLRRDGSFDYSRQFIDRVRELRF
jgi:hypothetical protein